MVSTGTAYPLTSQRNETALGLYFYNARWYDPSLGRFTCADTLVPAGVQGYDRFAYADNDPVRYTDPSGHYRIEDPGSKRGCTNLFYCANGQPYVRSPRPHQTSKMPQQPQGCTTVACKATNGDVGAVLELLFPSHWGWNVQAGGSVGFPVGIDFGVEVNVSVTYYWRTDQLIGNVDFGVGPGAGAKLPVPGQIAATTGPVLGWAQSDPNAGELSVNGGATIAAEGAVAGSVDIPINMTSNGPEFYVDPVYGQIPVTAYGGVGVGCCGAGGNVMVSGSIYQSDLSILLPWHWW